MVRKTANINLKGNERIGFRDDIFEGFENMGEERDKG